METKFKIGDVVVLKSQVNQRMTVSNVGIINNYIRCKWFYYGEIKEHDFLPETLEQVKNIDNKVPLSTQQVIRELEYILQDIKQEYVDNDKITIEEYEKRRDLYLNIINDLKGK